jgi:hypothetical protein
VLRTVGTLLVAFAALQRLIFAPIPAGVTTAPQPDGIPGQWTITMNAGPAQIARWGGYPWGTGPVNYEEAACYDPGNVSVGQFLQMAVTTTPCLSAKSGNWLPYTGAYLSGPFRQRYGAFEADIYLPADPSGVIANWPAFWLVAPHWPTGGEIDVMEGLGGRACSTFHYGTPADQEHVGPVCPTDQPGWHIFGASWSASVIRFYLDGKLTGVVTSHVTRQPMQVILDYTVSSGSAQTYPATMRVAWVRAWQGYGGATSG